MMEVNELALQLLKQYEGCRLEAYPDPATGGEPWTIGYGHTGGVSEGDSWTQAQADNQLLADLHRVAGQVRSCVHMDLNDNQFSAVCCLTFNIGIGNFSRSTMLKMINAGGLAQAADQFEAWDKAAGKEMPGLLKRRLAEKTLYLMPIG